MAKKKTKYNIDDYVMYNRDKIKYTDDESNYFGMLLEQFSTSDNQRKTNYNELNDMDYQTYYDSNSRAANSYIPEKKNKEDVRVVTGTTEEKENTIISNVLNYNFAANILAYDMNQVELAELGKEMEKMVKKSNELEKYDDKKPYIYKELFDQGSCFVEEQWIEPIHIEKKLKEINWNEINVKSIRWDTREVIDIGQCQRRLIAGDKVYPGNFRINSITKQPYLFIIDRISYAEAKSIFRNWDRFKYVQPDVVKFNNSDEGTYRIWTTSDLEKGQVEIVKYLNKWTNEFMIMLNGVMMLPIGFPLTEVSPSGEYPIAKAEAFPISEFFWVGKSIPAKTKVDQQVLDEFMKLIVLKTRKSFKPPLANNTNKILSEEIMMPGKVTNQVDPSKIQIIGDSNGVSLAEFNAFQFIKKIIDEKSLDPSFTGDALSKRQTATEILELRKQQMMKLGLVLWGVISLERQMSELRIANIIANWTKPIDTRINPITKKIEDVYRIINVDAEVEENVSGKNIIEFSPDASNISQGQVQEEAAMISRAKGMPIKKTYIDPKISNFKYNWYVTMNASERDSSDFERIMFKQDIQDSITLFGPQSLNFDYLRKRFASLSKQDPNKFFLSNVPSFPNQEGVQGGDQGGLGSQLNRGLGTAPMGQQ